MLHLSVMKVWDDGHWNIMTTLAELFWHDSQGYSRPYTSESEQKEIQYLVILRIERICNVMLEVQNTDLLSEYMKGVGHFIRDVGDENTVTLASHLVHKEGLFEVLHQQAYQEFLNDLNFARKGPRAAFEETVEDRWGFVDGIADSVLLVAQSRFDEGVVKNLAETGGMRWASGHWHSQKSEPSPVPPLPIQDVPRISLFSLVQQKLLKPGRKE